MAQKATSTPGLGTRLQAGWKGPRPPPLLPPAGPAASRCPYPGVGAGSPLLSAALGEAVLGPAPSPEQPSGSATLPARETPAAGVPGKQDPGVAQGAVADPAPPSLVGPLTYWSAAAWARTPRGAPVESCSPGEPCSPPRPPWSGWGVSPPSCGTEERGRGGEGGSFGKMPQHRGAAGGGGERRGLCSGAPCQLHAPALSRRRPAGHCGAGAAAALTICSTTGCHRGGSQRAPL